MRANTLGELLEAVEELIEAHGADVEVRMATQPNYPFEWSIGGVVAVDPSESDEDDDEGSDAPSGDGEVIVYILEGSQLGYASKRLWDEQ